MHLGRLPKGCERKGEILKLVEEAGEEKGCLCGKGGELSALCFVKHVEETLDSESIIGASMHVDPVLNYTLCRESLSVLVAKMSAE